MKRGDESFGEALKRLREQAGLSQVAVGRRAGYSKSYISDLECGRRPPHPGLAMTLDKVLSTGDTLLALVDQPSADTGTGTSRGSSTSADTDERWPRSLTAARVAVLTLWSESDADTGDSPTAAHEDAGLDAAVLQWLIASEDASVAHGQGWRRVGYGDVTRLRRVRRRLKALDNTFGGRTALPMALAYLRGEAAAVLAGHYDEAIGRELHAAVAEVEFDVGWMAYDADRHHLARRCFLQALRLAHAGNDRLLGGQILAAMSHQALHLGHVHQAVDLARAARAGTQQVATPRVVAMLASMEACAQAARGESALCEEALDTAEQALARSNRDDPAAQWLDFDEGGYWGHAARCYRDLRQAKKAEQYAARAVQLCLSGHDRTRAQRTAIEATAHLQLGNVDRAAELGLQLLEGARHLRSEHVNQDIAHLSEEIAPCEVGHDFVDQARDFLSASAPLEPR